MAAKPEQQEVLRLCDEALGLSGDARDAFLADACANDSRLRQSVDSVLHAITAAGDFLAADDEIAVSEESLIGQQIASYRLLEKLGQGGMGAVYLAEREHERFVQRVAFKVVRGQFLARELIDRFNAERRILARLNHPYIAALIDGGTTTHGIPYLVMEYIDGVPINDYCDRERLSLPARIRLIQKVAAAVQAAHQNLVVHRDLKPSNVLITDDGLPKLLDFGIAKMISADADEASGSTTLYGRQALTPDYASPEQILENRVTTASDVYSLGVLAYEILAGVRPYHVPRATHAELLHAVESLTVPRASSRLDTIGQDDTRQTIATNRATNTKSLRKALTGDLDNILMKALERDPQRRYVSVAAFSADLDRYLRNEPVEAQPDSLAYRARRFVSRHRFGVAVSALVASLLIAGTVGVSWAYLRSEAARAAASERFGQVRALTNTLMFDVYESIEAIPGTNGARQMLAKTAEQYLGVLAGSNEASDEVLLEAAEGYARLAAIMNQKAVNDAADREIAASADARAEALLARLVDSQTNSARVHLVKGLLHSNRGRMALYVDNDPEKARVELRVALEELGKVAALSTDDPGVTAATLEAQHHYADSFKWQNDHEEAYIQLTALIGEVEAAAERFPEQADVLEVAGKVYQLRGQTNWFRDNFEEGIGDYDLALARYRAALVVGGPDPAIDRVIADTLWSRGNSLHDLGRDQEAVDSYAAAMDILAIEAARDPGDAAIGRRLAILRGSRAAALARMGRGDEAIALMTETNDWFENQAAADPDTPGVQRSLAVSYHMMGNIHGDAGKPRESCAWFERTLQKWLDIDARFGLSDFDKGQPERLRGILAECR